MKGLESSAKVPMKDNIVCLSKNDIQISSVLS